MPTSTQDTIAIESRTTTGTIAAHALRRQGKIPGILFGHGSHPLAITLEARSLDDLLHAGAKSRLFSIMIDGKTKDTVLLRDIQRDPVTHRPIHADLQRVSATESIQASLRVVAVGIPEGVKNSGGVLDMLLHELEVQGPANELPDKIDIDVTLLNVHDHITAGQVKLPPKFTMMTSAQTIVLAIEPSRTAGEVEAVALPAPTPVEVPTVAETTKPEQASR